MTLPTVIFQVTAIGENTQALNETIQSVLYWERQSPSLGFRPLLWAVVEPEGYETDPTLYESWREAGAKVWIVPKEYRTPLGTTGKARALQYACDLRERLDLTNPEVWVYHQDEETCVGEDTLRGIAEFIRSGTKLIGAGVILYPVDWAPIPTHVQEFTRSYDDLRVLDSLTMPGNPTAGFHGSHFLVRADVEDSVGWDVSGYSPAEDLTFVIRLRARYGEVCGVLRGFAYVMGAFSMRDQLRQRRRWIRGIIYALRHSPVLSRRRKFTITYSAISWFSALPSALVLVASAFLHYGPLLLYTSLFSGFVWISMATGYIEGARLHAHYVHPQPGLLALIVLGLMGAFIDIVAPWYGLVTTTTVRDFVRKDRWTAKARSPARRRAEPGPMPAPHPSRRPSPWGGFFRRPSVSRWISSTLATGGLAATGIALTSRSSASATGSCRSCGRTLSAGEVLFYTLSGRDVVEPSCRGCLGRTEWRRFR